MKLSLWIAAVEKKIKTYYCVLNKSVLVASLDLGCLPVRACARRLPTGVLYWANSSGIHVLFTFFNMRVILNNISNVDIPQFIFL